MKKSVAVAGLALGISSVGIGQSDNPGINSQVSTNHVGPFTMPEGTSGELPLALGALGFWSLWRNRSGRKSKAEK